MFLIAAILVTVLVLIAVLLVAATTLLVAAVLLVVVATGVAALGTRAGIGGLALRRVRGVLGLVVAVGLRGVGEGLVARERRTRVIGPEDVGEFDGVGHRFDVGGIDLVQLLDIVENLGEIGRELGDFVVVELEAGEAGDSADGFGGELGHCRDVVGGSTRFNLSSANCHFVIGPFFPMTND